ncbi:ESCRT II complex subunit Dot2 [Mucor velutinosus]|uniref:ESCRT II complex subunit Dot2 n=1 Tax=Mucor velutinosus TaxID=708070 RepID=A0AAN7I4R0_9FUNG|nr:ESCRT II complex subunit Dot2 [Mucor velutinosus]
MTLTNTNNTPSPTTMISNTTAVQVALRVRPLTQQDRSQPRFSNSTDSDVIKTYENSVTIVPHQKSFQFDHVFDVNSTQEQVFTSVASNFVDRFIDGYNVTILAYGQTSSGKTYTMGTAIDDHSNPDQEGIIPRAMSALFQRLNDIQKQSANTNLPIQQQQQQQQQPQKRAIPASGLSTFPPASGLRVPRRSASTVKLRPVSMIAPPRRGSSSSLNSSCSLPLNEKSAKYTVHVSFIEIYNEELIDLLNPAPPHERTPVTIREDTKGHIIWTGLKEVPVGSTEDVLRFLQMGTENRATGSTDMNAKSSRSHAIFSVTLKQEKWVPSTKKTSPSVSRSTASNVSSGLNHRHSTLNVKAMAAQMEKRSTSPTLAAADEEDGEWMVSNSKFHFVDLAGSERLKRTAAQGDRRKEGININAGLLALGNVISALSDPSSKKSTHVPYRDSKLTRLLQDSLGGNSTTLMIACVSPAEINLTETINTIKYAYRARNIRNKTEKNEAEEWMTSDNLDHLRQIISKLKMEVKMLKNSSPHHRNSPSPMSSTGSGSPKAHTTVFAHGHHGIISPSSSSISDSDPHPSTCPSMSATTNITMPDSSTSLELCDAQNHGSHNNDVAIMVADLRRQIEELQNEVTVTRERNLLVEKELRQKASTTEAADNEFQHLVEPVIEEYEKSISGLESQLAMARAALSHSEQALEEQQAKITEYETMQATEVQALEELKARLSAAIDRERSSETYCLELEAQLQKSVHDGHKDQQILSELREKIMKFKEMDEHTEQYISDLEARISASELEKTKLTEKIASLSVVGDVSAQHDDLAHSEASFNQALEKQLAECQTKCQELEQELALVKEQHVLKAEFTDRAIQSKDYVDKEKATKIAELAALLTEKESQVLSLESRLDEINAMKSELAALRQSHLDETTRLEDNLTNLKAAHQTQLLEEQQRSQELQDTLKSLTETHASEMNQAKSVYADLQHEMRQQEIASQSTLREHLQELEKFKSDINALQLVEEKQDAIIQGLEAKLEEMDRLVSSLQTQLEERNQTIQLLEADNASKTEAAATMQRKLESVLKDVCGMGSEKKQLERVMSFVEGTLRLQDAKSDKTMETLEDIKHHYKVREEEIEEKRRTVNLLSAEKDELSQSLERISQRASQGDAMVKNLESELSEARLSLSEQANLVLQLKQEQSQTEFELQRVQALEARVQELDKEIELQQQAKSEKQKELEQLEHAVQKQLVQNEELIRTIAELEATIKEERALASLQDSTGMVAELESKLTALQQAKKREDDVWKAQMEKTKEELFITRKENMEYKQKIEQLQASLAQVKKEIATVTPVNSSFETITVDESEDEQDLDLDHVECILHLKNEASSSSSNQQDLLNRIMQLQEDNAQLLKHNDDLESQLVLQRGQLTLETKNLELELMKLTAANDRLEKEMEQVIPRSSATGLTAHNRESMQFTSPPQTPRVSSPPPPTASNSTGSIIQYKLQRDISQSSIAKLSKSGSYRSVSTMLIDGNHNAAAEEEALKRMSSISMKSDVVPRPSSSLRSSRTLINSSNLPPPTAPPSNPLPPIPTPLPALPSAPSSPLLLGGTTGDLSDHGSDPGSPSMHPITVGASSQSSLHRQDSTASTSFSEIMNSTSSANFTSEQYDKLIRSLQRKAQFAENDVRAHQEVISKLESQLSRSESSVREVKKQLDLLSREKQAYNLEIQNLRTQVTQIQTQQKTLSDESSVERKELEEKLEQQKLLKEKAEKARRILENRMDELMNKKSKFMCF